MSKKNFNKINNPALQFISTSAPVKHKPGQEVVSSKGQTQESVPEKENKTRRMQLLVRPSLYENMKKLSIMKHANSVNDLVNQILEEYTEDNKDALERYNEIF